MEQINVNLGDRSYLISVGRGLLADPCYFSEAKGRKVALITNETVAPLYADLLFNTLQKAGAMPALLVLPDGEQYKTLDTFNLIHTFLLQNNYGRDVLLIALGGGVIGDLVGFVAACFLRGVDFIQVPTTLLSQVDSSVGGKTAVNHPLGKNMIGAFYQPKSVIIDIDVLASLPAREFAAGMAEVIKYGIIIDKDFFIWLEENINVLNQIDENALKYAIKQCCQIKANIVAKDEKESGLRALLNLGHTFGHAIEAQMGYGKWLHGEAVSVGIVMAATTSFYQQKISKQDLLRIIQLLKKANLPLKAPCQMDLDAFLLHMKRDKKVLSGQLRFIVPTSIGSAEVVSDVTSKILADVIASH